MHGNNDWITKDLEEHPGRVGMSVNYLESTNQGEVSPPPQTPADIQF